MVAMYAAGTLRYGYDTMVGKRRKGKKVNPDPDFPWYDKYA